MNVNTESAITWLNLTSYDHPSSNSNSSSIKSNNTEFFGEDGPTAQVWDIRWFAILSAPLLFVTIILPLLIGPVLRSTIHSHVKLRPYWRAALGIPALCLWIWSYAGLSRYSRYTVKYSPYTVLYTRYTAVFGFDVCHVGLLMGRIWLSRRSRRHAWLWIFFALFSLALLLLDVWCRSYVVGWIGWVVHCAIISYRRWRRYQANQRLATRRL